MLVVNYIESHVTMEKDTVNFLNLLGDELHPIGDQVFIYDPNGDGGVYQLSTCEIKEIYIEIDGDILIHNLYID